MAEARFTPGPWRHRGGCTVTSTDDLTIACVSQGSRLTCRHLECATLIAGRQEADARLIAASPDIYAACEAAAKGLRVLATVLAALQCYEGTTTAAGLADDCDAALNLARGES